MKRNKLFLSLSGLLLLTLIIASLSVNVQGANTLDYTFENNIFYEVNNPSIDSSINIRNQTTFTENYKASYSFENDVVGEIPEGFIVNETGGTVRVYSSIYGHSKIVRLVSEGSNNLVNLYKVISRENGTIEFYILLSETNHHFYVYVMDGVDTSGINIDWTDTGKLQYNDGSWHEIDTYVSNVWYHIRIDFECGAGSYKGLSPDTFNIYVDGKKNSNLGFRGTGITIDTIKFRSRTATVGTTFIDALGFTWYTASYTGTHFSVATQDGTPQGITYDGSNFWIVGDDNNEVYKYNSEGVYTGTSFNVGTQDTSPTDITWDGSNFWILGNVNDEVYKYNSEGVYTGTSFNVGIQETVPLGINWDGFNFWVVGNVNDEVYKYNSEGIYMETSFNVGIQDATPTGIIWDGSNFWIVGNTNDEVYKYNSEGIYTETHFDVETEDGNPQGITWDGSNFWILGLNTHEVYKYKYVEFYNISDNLIPYNYKNNIQEIDKWTFFNNEDGSLTDNYQENIPYWTRLMIYSKISKGYGGLDNTTVRVPITSSTPYGIYKDFQYSSNDVIEININIALDISSNSVEFMNTFQIKSFDDTLIVKIMFDYYSETQHKLFYWDGSDYIFLQYLDNTFLFRSFNFTIINNLVILIIENNCYIFPIIVSNKDGLGEIRIDVDVDIGGVISYLYIDFVGVYINGTSLSNDFANYFYNTNKIFNNKKNNLFTLEATGFFGISITSFFSIYRINYFLYQNVSEISFTNVHDYGERNIINACLVITTNTTFTLDYILINGVKLIEGSNIYYPMYTHAGINTNKTYFWVDSNNKLQFSLIVDDDNLEYIQATFNVNDVPTENRSISFASNINGNSRGFFSLDYTDDTINLMEFPYYQTTTKVILPQTKMIKSFTILITDNNLDNSDVCNGYISSISLIYNPDIGITILTIELLGIIVPLMIMIIPSIVMGKKFGITGTIITFVLMSLICVISNLIPIWMFFIIAFCTIGLLFMKKKIEVRI